MTEPIGMWSTTDNPTKEQSDSARPLLEAAFVSGETRVVTDGVTWTFNGRLTEETREAIR